MKRKLLVLTLMLAVFSTGFVYADKKEIKNNDDMSTHFPPPVTPPFWPK